MFFVFLISVSCVCLVVTGSCLRVLGESYKECVVEYEENSRSISEHAGQQDVNIDDDEFWNEDSEYHIGDQGGTKMNNNSQLPFHYQLVFKTLSNLPIEVAFGLFSLLCAWSLTSLTCFHALIITLAQTTNERVRGVYQYGGIGNPADMGCWKNWICVLCGKVPESRIPRDFSAVVTLPQEVALKKNDNNISNEKDGDANNNDKGKKSESSSLVLKEETVWPGWQDGMLH